MCGAQRNVARIHIPASPLTSPGAVIPKTCRSTIWWLAIRRLATGAQQLTAEQRHDLANDPLNLQAVAGPVNQSKGAGDAAPGCRRTRRPGAHSSHVRSQVKAKYQLWVKPAEHDAIARVLRRARRSLADRPDRVH